MPEEKTLDTLHNAVSTLRETVDEMQKKNGGTAELEAKMSKVQKDLDMYEEKSQQVQRENAEREQKNAEQVERINELETKLAKINTFDPRSREAKRQELEAEVKNLYSFCEKGAQGNSELETKYLQAGSNADGGFIMREANDDMILKPITETSPIRPYCRIKRTDALVMNGATRESLVAGYWVGEGQTVTQDNSKYGKPSIPVHKMALETRITIEAINGGQWDMESEIMGDFAERRLQMEGNAFVLGNGVSKPSGFVPKLIADSKIMASGSAATYDFDSLLLLTGELKDGYNPMFGFNRSEAAFIRTLKDDAGGYAWQPGNLAAGIPSSVGGYGYVVLPDMADKGTNAYPVVFADWKKMYTIVDAFQAYMQRNPYKVTGFIDFSLLTFVGGDVMMSEAGVLLKCATS